MRNLNGRNLAFLQYYGDIELLTLIETEPIGFNEVASA